MRCGRLANLLALSAWCGSSAGCVAGAVQTSGSVRLEGRSVRTDLSFYTREPPGRGDDRAATAVPAVVIEFADGARIERRIDGRASLFFPGCGEPLQLAGGSELPDWARRWPPRDLGEMILDMMFFPAWVAEPLGALPDALAAEVRRGPPPVEGRPDAAAELARRLLRGAVVVAGRVGVGGRLSGRIELTPAAWDRLADALGETACEPAGRAACAAHADTFSAPHAMELQRRRRDGREVRSLAIRMTKGGGVRPTGRGYEGTSTGGE